MNCNGIRNTGDIFLLFHRLPYDYGLNLPIQLGPGIYLDYTPRDILNSADPQALADYVLPGFNVPDRSIPNCCLRAEHSCSRQEGPNPKDLLFLAILGLRLQAPISIQVAGKFELGSGDDLIREPELFSILSSWHPHNSKKYTANDLKKSEKIVNKIIDLGKLHEKKLMSAVIFFSHASCGLSKSLQLAHLGLFTSLEALFTPKGNKAKSLAKRVSSFLRLFDADCSLENWIKEQYIRRRSELAHGIQDVYPWIKLRQSKINEYGKLHEIVRLCILGFLNMEDSYIMNLTEQSGNRLQQALDNLLPAKGVFLEDQSMWLG